MKKIIAVIFLLCLFYGNFTYTDLSEYGSRVKTVEIKGEIMHPGVYEVERSATVQDIITVAGGLLLEADTSSINLTQDASNNAVIVIPLKQTLARISINSATAEQLDMLKGVGPAVAARIIEYRSHTPFKNIEDLKNVKGIGDKMFENIKEAIVL